MPCPFDGEGVWIYLGKPDRDSSNKVVKNSKVIENSILRDI
jgi:hypothetical protein